MERHIGERSVDFVTPPTSEDILKEIISDVEGYQQRRDTWLELARSPQVDLVWIIAGCDDAREDVPCGIKQIIDKDSNLKNVLFVMVSRIGGGVATNVLTGAIGTYRKHGIGDEKFRITTAQHAGTLELSEKQRTGVYTCGLRGVLAAYDPYISAIRQAQGNHKKKLLSELASVMHDAFPVEALDHYISVNFSADPIINRDQVYLKTAADLSMNGTHTIPFSKGIFDHNHKVIEIVEPDGRIWELVIPHQRWDHTHQNPLAITVKLGEVTAFPDDVVAPSLTNLVLPHNMNRAFTSSSLRNFGLALLESLYALSHAKTKDSNFRDTQIYRVDCDDYNGVSFTKGFIDRYARFYVPHLRRLGGMYITNLEAQTAEHVFY